MAIVSPAGRKRGAGAAPADGSPSFPGESGVQEQPPLPEREVSSHHSSSKIPRKDGEPCQQVTIQ